MIRAVAVKYNAMAWPKYGESRKIPWFFNMIISQREQVHAGGSKYLSNLKGDWPPSRVSLGAEERLVGARRRVSENRNQSFGMPVLCGETEVKSPRKGRYVLTIEN